VAVNPRRIEARSSRFEMGGGFPKHSGVIIAASTGLSARDRTLAPEDDVTFEATAKPSHARDTKAALTAALATAAIAAATLAAAWFFQLVLDIRPCPLCLEQRYAYYLAIPLGALVALAAARNAPRAVLVAGLALLALAALANAFLGGYHAGVEWGFWPGPTECSGPLLDLGKAASLFDNLDKVKVIRCDQVQWRFLGVSLAGYNVLISLGMSMLAAWGIARSVRLA
jgi:disulfide bond formation protein DsbB